MAVTVVADCFGAAALVVVTDVVLGVEVVAELGFLDGEVVFTGLDSAFTTSSACSSQKKFLVQNRIEIDPDRLTQFPEEIGSFDYNLLIL